LSDEIDRRPFPKRLNLTDDVRHEAIESVEPWIGRGVAEAR
jgi:hypothetical protein